MTRPRLLSGLLSAFIAFAALSGTKAHGGPLSAVIAGSGPGYPASGSFAGDDGWANQAYLKAPAAASIEGNGAILIVDSLNQRIRRLQDGRITTIAGSGEKGDCGDNLPAKDLCLGVPHGVLTDRKGGFWIADTFNSKIRYVSPSGKAETVLGGSCEAESWACSQEGYYKNVRLALPIAIKPAPHGGKIITDAGTHRVLLWRGNKVTIIAGTGQPTLSGDGGPAREAAIWQPQDAVAYQGGYLIADGGNCRLRQVDRKGIIKTIAGKGIGPDRCRLHIDHWLPGPEVKSGPALSAPIAVVSSVATRGRTIYISDFLGGRVRKIENGRIRTIAGKGGVKRYDADSIPGQSVPSQTEPIDTPLVFPSGISICRSGDLIVADPGNSRLWQIGSKKACV